MYLVTYRLTKTIVPGRGYIPRLGNRAANYVIELNLPACLYVQFVCIYSLCLSGFVLDNQEFIAQFGMNFTCIRSL